MRIFGAYHHFDYALAAIVSYFSSPLRLSAIDCRSVSSSFDRRFETKTLVADSDSRETTPTMTIELSYDADIFRLFRADAAPLRRRGLRVLKGKHRNQKVHITQQKKVCTTFGIVSLHHGASRYRTAWYVVAKQLPVSIRDVGSLYSKKSASMLFRIRLAVDSR